MKILNQVEVYIALKLDMSNAYDRIEWSFLEAALLKLGLDENWMARVMECVKIIKFFSSY